MPFLLLLLLTLVCVPDEWMKSPWDAIQNSFESALLTWQLIALVVAGVWVVSVRTAFGLLRTPRQREALLSRYSRFRTYHTFLLIGAFAASLYGLGWGWAVQQWCGSGNAMLPGAELLILAPFLVGLVLSWAAFYDAERAIYETAALDSSEPFQARGTYVLFHIRQNLALLCAPLVLLLFLKGVGRAFPETRTGVWQLVLTFSGAVLAGGVIIGMPWLLRLALGLVPMPPCPLRERLESTARRLHFRCSNILVWKTHNGMANAMVAGVVPWVRYVILTDRLMSELTPEEVEAVFGHEIGHAKHHHMLYYLGFLIVSVFLVATLCVVIADCLGPYVPILRSENKTDTTLTILPLVMMLGAYIFVVFGFLSRRCERQTDVFGCRAVSCTHTHCGGHDEATELAEQGRGLCSTGIRTFIEALEKVARLNGISRDKPGWLSSWQHSTIARRVGFLQDVLADRTLERRFQRRVGLVKWALLLGLLATLAALWGAAAVLDDKQPDQQSEDGQSSLVMPHTAGHTAPWE